MRDFGRASSAPSRSAKPLAVAARCARRHHYAAGRIIAYIDDFKRLMIATLAPLRLLIALLSAWPEAAPALE